MLSAFTGFISLISNFVKLLITGVESVISFGKMVVEYLQLFSSFIPVQFTALFLIVVIVSLIYLIVGR